MALTQKKLFNLFAGYNNINDTTVAELVDYLFKGILPISGGTIEGNLIINGQLRLTGASGQIFDNAAVPKKSIDPANRALFDDTGANKIIDWTSTNKLGFFATPPVIKQTVDAVAVVDVPTAATAIDSIRTALSTIGLFTVA